MAYCAQNRLPMPHERSLLMPFSVRQIALDDKLCHHVNLDVLQEVYPPGNRRAGAQRLPCLGEAGESPDDGSHRVPGDRLDPLSAFDGGRSLAPLGQRRTLPLARPPRGGGDRWRDLPTAAAIGRDRPAAVASAPLSPLAPPRHQVRLLTGLPPWCPR